MYHKIRDQELHPENYYLKEIDPGWTEDECFDLISRPKQTQKTIGLYLKKIKGAKDAPKEKDECEQTRYTLGPDNIDLEREVNRNKGFWVGRPELSAEITYKLREKFSVDIGAKTKREQGIFYRPKKLELAYTMNLANAGLLYPDEDISDSEEEILPDDTSCLPLRKIKHKLCDPCKPKKEKPPPEEPPPPKDLIEEMRMKGVKPPFKKIPTGCQCDYFGTHNKRPTVWDLPYKDETDMLRQHEMDKYFGKWSPEGRSKCWLEYLLCSINGLQLLLEVVSAK